jgi:hypothetical protein
LLETGSNPGAVRSISTYDSQADRGSTYRGEVEMVEITRQSPVMVFKVLDRNGEPIGEVVQPKVAPIVGRGARTVLLVRSEQRSMEIR